MKKSFKYLIQIIFYFSTLRLTVGVRTYKDQDLETWTAPIEIQRDIPYYFSGSDYDGQPVFTVEAGKWPGRKWIEYGSEEDKIRLDKYFEQMFYRFNKTAQELKHRNDTDTGSFAVICDMEGYDASQLAHIPTVSFTLTNFTLRFQEDFSENFDYGFIINSKIFAKLDTFGTNKDQWIPKLLRKIPRESLPPWYGGVQEFKPVAIYG